MSTKDSRRTQDQGRVRARVAMAELLAPELTPTPFFLIDILGRELDEYFELIVGPGPRGSNALTVGFMTRGEGRLFTERARVALEHLGMPEAALDHHRALAEVFEHKRGFFKLEWHPSGPETVQASPLAACYFRRRPPVGAALQRLRQWGVAADTCSFVAEVARVLEKTTIHFTAAAFRPEQSAHHNKLYFSQYITPESRAQVSTRIERVFGLFGTPAGLRETWQQHHESCVASTEPVTVFVSVSFSANGLVPSFKIDYPDVSTDQAAAWLPERERGRLTRDTAAARRLAGTDALTFLGVRFSNDRLTPSLKYYCDTPLW